MSEDNYYGTMSKTETMRRLPGILHSMENQLQEHEHRLKDIEQAIEKLAEVLDTPHEQVYSMICPWCDRESRPLPGGGYRCFAMHEIKVLRPKLPE